MPETAGIPTANLPSPVSADAAFSESQEALWGDDNLAFVRTMEYLVRNGMVPEMEAFIARESPAPYGQLAFDDLRHIKNSMMIHIYIIRTAAREGGLSEALGIRLAEEYSRRCEAAASVGELRRISQTLRIDFCRRVRDIQHRSVSDPAVRAALRYIDAHYMEKLDAARIAAAVGLAPSYLCVRIRQETGRSIVDHIQAAKTVKAKQLLALSDRSLSEIASYLGFSSQNYFQTVFKKQAGMTPLAYRRSQAGLTAPMAENTGRSRL
ncbi:MAG: AraC family transcriptional regulator [Clostridia bacterium]|nr:AraC family transcriptional regulator [Clostridia bacterium]